MGSFAWPLSLVTLLLLVAVQSLTQWPWGWALVGTVVLIGVGALLAGAIVFVAGPKPPGDVQ